MAHYVVGRCREEIRIRILPVDVAGPLGVAPELGLYASAALNRMCAEKLCTGLYRPH